MAVTNTRLTPAYLLDATIGSAPIYASLDPRLWDASIGGDASEEYPPPAFGYSLLTGPDGAYLTGADGSYLYGAP